MTVLSATLLSAAVFSLLSGCGEPQPEPAPQAAPAVLDDAAHNAARETIETLPEPTQPDIEPDIEEDEVEASLNALGVNTSQTPRPDEAGADLPPDFNPLGQKVRTLKRQDELFIVGLPTEEGAQAEGFTAKATAEGPAMRAPFTGEEGMLAAGDLRAATTGDLDHDPFQEVVVAYVEEDQVRIWTQDDEQAAFGTVDFPVLELPGIRSIEIAAGDFDGDSKDELLIALTQATSGQFLLLDDKDQDFDVLTDPVVIEGLLEERDLEWELGVGNLDYDGAEELALVLNELPDAGDFGDGLARFFVFDDLNRGLDPLEDGFVQGLDDGIHTSMTAGVAIGDIDADGLGEVILAGNTLLRDNDDQWPALKLIVVALDDAVHGLDTIAARYHELNVGTSGSGYNAHLAWRLDVNAIDSDGDTIAELQVNQFIFDDVRSEPFALLAQIPDGNFALNESGYTRTRANSAISIGDVDGDGREDVVFANYANAGANELPGAFAFGFDEEGNFGQVGTVYGAWGEQTGRPLLVATNFDDDATIIEFDAVETDLVFTQPIILAVLAAAPCSADIGQNEDGCSTSWGQAHSEAMETEQGVTLSASFSVGVSIEDRVFSQSALEIEASVSTAVSMTQAHATSIEKAVTFTSGPLEDTVVFTTLPYDRYRYKIVRNPEDPSTEGEYLEVMLPREPVTLMVQREFYNQHVEAGAVNIGSDVLGHTVGDVGSYPSSYEAEQTLDRFDGLKSEQVGVGQGNGQVETSIAVGEELSTGMSWEIGFELSVKLTAGGVMGGFSVGASYENSLTVTHGSATTYAGSVGALDAEHFADDHYSFGLFTYVHETDDGQRFEVVNYWVD